MDSPLRKALLSIALLLVVTAPHAQQLSGTASISGEAILTKGAPGPPPSPCTSAAVVPCAFGYGMTTRAAYGLAPGTQPTIVHVTSLADSGAGTLRDAISGTGLSPRVVVFDTSGTIVFNSDIDTFSNYMTIAGQTAPSPGIQIRNGGLNFYGHDILIQHLRIRPGDGGPLLPQTQDHDASIVYDCSGCPTQYTPHDIVFDHMSLSWSGGKLSNADARSPTSNITYWRTMFSEALYRAINVIVSAGQPSSLSLPIVDHTAQVSVIQNLFAHSSDRNPEIHSGTFSHFVNNVVYDWGRDENPYPWATFFYGVEADALFADIVGNVYIVGGSPHPTLPLYAIGWWKGPSGSQIYTTDNLRDQTLGAASDFFLNTGEPDPRVGSPPVPLTGFTVLAGSATKASVLTSVGARPANRDSVETRIISDVTNYTGVVISSQTAVGSWPTYAVNTATFVPVANPNVVTASGYTNLEVQLHSIACGVEGTIC